MECSGEWQLWLTAAEVRASSASSQQVSGEVVQMHISSHASRPACV